MRANWGPGSRRVVAACIAVLSLEGCAGMTVGSGIGSVGEGKIITAEQIRRSGAINGWEALKRNGTHLSMHENIRGEPSRLSYRGQNSIVLSSTPVLYVDGAQMAEFTYLRDVPAKIIRRIRILSGVSGTKYFGTGGGNGVILVETSAAQAAS